VPSFEQRASYKHIYKQMIVYNFQQCKSG